VAMIITKTMKSIKSNRKVVAADNYLE